MGVRPFGAKFQLFLKIWNGGLLHQDRFWCLYLVLFIMTIKKVCSIFAIFSGLCPATITRSIWRLYWIFDNHVLLFFLLGLCSFFIWTSFSVFLFTFQGPTPLRLGPIESVPNIIADLIGSGRKKAFWLFRNFWPESGSTLAIMENVKWNESLIEKLSFKDEILSILKCYCLMWNVNMIKNGEKYHWKSWTQTAAWQ